MITSAARYDHPAGGQYAETMATLADGRVVTVNTQYAIVLPHGRHSADCDQVNTIGGQCTCGLLDGIDIAALVAEARTNGKLGAAPAGTPGDVDEVKRNQHGLCPQCGTYCCGDCK